MSSSDILTARDVMTQRVIKLDPDMTVAEAANILIEASISGAPVVGDDDSLLGVLSMYDVLRIVATDDFDAETYHEERDRVSEFMTRDVFTVPPHLGIYAIAHKLVAHRVQRLPVVERGKLLGLIGRRDVLVGIGRMRRARELQQKAEQVKKSPTGLYLSATDSDPNAIPGRRKK